MSQPRTGAAHFRRIVTLGTAALLVTSMLAVLRLDDSDRVGARAVTVTQAKSFAEVRPDLTPVADDGGAWAGPRQGSWPKVGTAAFAVASRPDRTANGMAGGIPVRVSAVAGARAPERVRIATLDEKHSRQLGVSGPVLTVDGDAGQVEATLDYAGFQELYGAGWGHRLTLVRLPACAATTPNRSECQEPTRVDAENDAAKSLLSTTVNVSDARPLVLAITASDSSEDGDYKATDLKASGSWTAGDSSGAFTYSNPLRLPPAVGPVPEVSLNYSSQTVDGRMAGSNNQASWVGDGWDYEPGYVERTYFTCVDDRAAVSGSDPNNKDKKTYDQCWKGTSPNITVSLNGANTTLVKDDASGAWRAQHDSNWRVELSGSAASTSTATTERWTITTPDGTQYFFASEPVTSASRWTVPVFGNHPAEPCHATAFKDSSCQQAWRWLLDKAIDVHGNMTRYYYTSETGHYGAADDKDNRVSFTRGGHLNRIEYGLHTAHPSVAATARVVFDVADRCLATECYKDGKPVNANWPDVPWDKDCAATPCTDKLAPVFFNTKRLVKVRTQVRGGATFVAADDVESWSLTHEFKAPKVAGSASLWLKEIQHAGHVGGTITEPAVRFTGVELANRANVLAGAPLFSRWRLQNVRTESGADLHVTYSEPDCDSHDLPATPQRNTRRCYPVYWMPDGYTEPKLDWFHKYVVEEISEIDRTADQPAVTTQYEYSTNSGGTNVLWGWDDGEFTKKQHRTYGQWRGYAQVFTRVGTPDQGAVVTTRKRFYRGLHDQPLPGGTKRDVEVTDSENNTYVDHPALAGQVMEDAVLDGTTVVEAAVTQYWTSQTAARAHTGGTDRAYLTGPSVIKTRKRLSPGNWGRTEVRITYNSEGLPTEESNLGDTSKSGDETCTRTTYVTNSGKWIRETVSRVETVAKACSATPNRPDDVISDVRTYFDGSDTHGAAPTEGLVTRQDILDEWSGGPVYATVGRSSYDTLGRVVRVTDARGGVTTTTYTPAGPGPVTQMVTHNPLEHSVTTYQDPAWAEPTAIVDANGKRTDLTHDPLGRLTKVWLPGRAKATHSANLEFAYLVRDNGPLAVTTKRLAPNGNYLTEIGLFDSLYRPVQSQEEGLGGSRLVTSTGYNDRGVELYKSGPNYAAGAPSDSLLAISPGEDRARTIFSYDSLGRTVTEALWSRSSHQWSTTLSYGGNSTGWQVTVTPPQGESATASITDLRGQMVELRQFHGGSPTGAYDATTYTYTSAGELASVSNALGQVRRYEYDLRGREVRTVDPDKGTTTVAYDNADDVTSSTNALSDQISTEYDDLGRQVKRFVNGVLAGQWTYDTVQKGHLSKTESIVNGWSYVREITLYNDAYQVVDEETVIPAAPGLEAVARRYVSTYTYKVDGSPERMSLPRVGGLESEIVGHTYDDLGNVTRLVGTSYPSGTNTVYVDGATYSPYGELQDRRLGVNSRPQAYQTYVYDDATRRLTDFYFDRDGTVNSVAALKYTYDPAGNVLSMANRPRDNDGNPRPGVSDVQCFQYDHLRRLNQAWTQGVGDCASPTADTVGGVAPYWKSYDLNEAGSRRSVTDHRAGTTSTYGYPAANATQPNAVRSVTTGSRVDHYDWDVTGNLTYRMVFSGASSRTLRRASARG